MSTWKVLRYLALVLIVVTGSMALAGCRDAVEETEADETPPPTPAAATVFAANCAGCHGQDGSGGARGPAIRPTDKDEAELLTIIADGIAGTDMPAYRGRISEAEVRAVIDYLRQK
jgi:mono/diheme cytochrome c family protein